MDDVRISEKDGVAALSVAQDAEKKREPPRYEDAAHQYGKGEELPCWGGPLFLG